MRPEPPERSPRALISKRVEPFWLNPATIKGTIAILGGVTILTVPDLSALLIRIVLSISLIIGGISDLWFGLRHRRRSRSIVEGAITTLFGALVLLFPSQTLRGVALVAAAFLAVRGLSVVATAFSMKHEGRTLHVVRGLLFLSVATFLLLIPQALIETIGAGLAAAAVIIGAIVLAYGVRERSDADVIDVDIASVTEMIGGWLRERDLGPEHRDRIGDSFFFEGEDRSGKLASWWVMLLLSVGIATFGIIQDSTAVVIGAMLIAPLMVPILGIGAGIVNAWSARVTASFTLVIIGAGAAIALAFVIGQWVPIIVPLSENSQVTSRVAPNLIDMLIALAAGAAGAYANVNDRVADSIAGVAIAVALVPPLAVVGLTLQAGMVDDSLGALLLFLTNLVSIVLAATVVFFLTGYAPIRRLQEDRETIASLMRTVALAAIVIVIPLVLTADDILTDTSHQREANDDVEIWLEGSTLSAVRVDVDDGVVSVFLTGPDEVPPIEALQTALEEDFGSDVEVRIEHAATTVLTSG